MNFHKYSQKITIIAAVVWFVLALCARFGVLPLTLSFLYIYFGALVCALGLQNLIILNIAARNNSLPDKIKHYEERFGTKYGLIYYVVLSVLSFLIIGIIVIICGFVL